MSLTHSANNPSRTLLVTGAAGFIGSNFVRAALQAGYRVVGLDCLTYAGLRENLEGLSGPFEFLQENILSPRMGEIFARHKPQALLNFAAESHVDRSITGPLVFAETNVLGTAKLLQHALQHWQSQGKPSDFRFVQVSTDEVYGSLGESGAFHENTPLRPSSPYSASKAGGDHLVNAWHHTYGLPTLITRCSNNYGPFQLPEKLIPHMIQCALAGKSLPVYGDGRHIRDWIHVADHCQGILLALAKGLPGSTYCFGGRSEKSNLELVQRICQELDRKRPRAQGSYQDQITFVTDRLGHDFRYAIDDSLAERELGFTRAHDLESGLSATIDWYLSHEDWVKTAQARIESGAR